MKLSDILAVLEGLAPLRYAEPWDNVGLLVGDPAAEVRRILVTVDYTAAVAEEAVATRAELVLAYHPPMFAAVKRVPHDALWADAIRRGIALYSPHTALDVARNGTNDFLADACGIVAGDARRPLRPFVGRDIDEPASIGLGRVGPIVSAPLEGVVRKLKSALGLEALMLAGDPARSVTRVAVAAGAGGELLEVAIRAGGELFVTGEIRHHDALAALRRGTAVIATLHSNSERAAVRAHAAAIDAALDGVVVATSDADADPFVFV